MLESKLFSKVIKKKNCLLGTRRGAEGLGQRGEGRRGETKAIRKEREKGRKVERRRRRRKERGGGWRFQRRRLEGQTISFGWG